MHRSQHRSQHLRSKDTQGRPQPSSMPVVLSSHSSASLSSSFSSSAASSLLLPAAPLSNASQSDILAPDLSLHPSISTASSSKARFFPLSIHPASRSSSLTHMGQAISRPVDATSTSSQPNTTSSTGARLKRAWAGRRKKQEDVTSILAQDIQNVSDKSKRRDSLDKSMTMATPVSSRDSSQVQPLKSVPHQPARGAKHFIPFQLSSSLNVFGNKRHSQSPKSPMFSGSAPPPALPPKPSDLQTPKKMITQIQSTVPPAGQRSSLAPLSPSTAATILSIQGGDHAKEGTPTHVTERPDKELKQDWRKSDSTMTSHVTIRPGAFGNRSPRPVSLAESSHSGHTIVPVNRRLSALITDAEFAMPEEGDLGDIDQDVLSKVLVSARASPSSSVKARHRRSMSLNIGLSSGYRSKPSTPEPVAAPVAAPSPDIARPSMARTFSDTPPVTPSSSRDTPTLTRAAAKGFIAPVNPSGANHTTGSNIRGRLAAWTAASSSNRSDRPLPPPPPPPSRSPPINSTPHPSFRQTAVSMTGSLAPSAAGIAMGIGKRAAERVHRVLGGFNSSSSSHSGYSSSSSTGTGTTSSSYSSSKYSNDAFGHSASDQSAPSPFMSSGGGWPGKSKRRTPNAPSGSWSVASSATSGSISDCDALSMPTGPNLGTRLRGPRRTSSGAPVAGGLVFRRDLQTCVRETAIDRCTIAAKDPSTENADPKDLEDRLLPALVVRCAQHLRTWGVQEEGLFRVSGRPAHVAKLRSEFDTGADYNLVESDPGDLDPHAVASIFKAYLRELPQSLLTTALKPHFESLLTPEASDEDLTSVKTGPRLTAGSKGPSLPSGPRAGNPLPLRKPPSLSTLAMPSFAGARAMSEATLGALASLIAMLPSENRDILLTVVELIQATAAHSKDTKMPLGNLLLVFCPSLNMSPTLLRILCETKSIWNGPPKGAVNPVVLDIASADPPIMDIGPATQLGVNKGDVQSQVAGPPPTNVSSAADSLETTDVLKSNPDVPAARPRPLKARGPAATIYVQASQISESSLNLRSSALSGCLDDAASYVSALEGPIETSTRPSTPGSSFNLPPLSSSTDSLATPSTMSENTSFTQPSVDERQAGVEKPDSSRPDGPTIVVETGDLSLPPTLRRPAISSPIPFPSTGGSTPHTPISARKSFALLSFPPLRSDPGPASSSASSWRRGKRPSLTLLFSKKSMSQLSTASAEAGPSPNSAPPLDSYTHTAPASSVSLAPPRHFLDTPPVLDTTISSSPMHLGFEERVGTMTKDMISTETSPYTAASSTPDTGNAPRLHIRTDSFASSLFSTPQQTPIAAYFRSRNPSLLPTRAESRAEAVAAPSEFPRSPSQCSLTPSIDVGIENSMEEDWAESVIQAARADGVATAAG